MRFKIPFFLMMSIFSSASYAGPGTGAFTISKIHIERGDVYIVSEESIPDPLGCKTPNFVKLNKDDVGFNQMYSMALAAFSSGAKISFWVTSCDSSPWSNGVQKAYAAQTTK